MKCIATTITLLLFCIQITSAQDKFKLELFSYYEYANIKNEIAHMAGIEDGYATHAISIDVGTTLVWNNSYGIILGFGKLHFEGPGYQEIGQAIANRIRPINIEVGTTRFTTTGPRFFEFNVGALKRFNISKLDIDISAHYGFLINESDNTTFEIYYRSYDGPETLNNNFYKRGNFLKMQTHFSYPIHERVSLVIGGEYRTGGIDYVHEEGLTLIHFDDPLDIKTRTTNLNFETLGINLGAIIRL